jgi:DNA-binding beta-propeller fold protein YncE
MRWRMMRLTALLGLAGAVAVACGSSGGGDKTTITTRVAFPQGFFPVLLQGALSDPCQSGVVRTAGDVTMRNEGDMFAVAQTSDVYALSRTDGSCRVFASAPIGTRLLSIILGSGDDNRLFAGDDVGQIWVIPASGGAATPYTDTGSQPITGLAFAPNGYGDVEGSLLAAAGTAGVVRITISDAPVAANFAPSPGGSIVDLAFSGNTLFAIRRVDATHGQIDKIDANGTTGTAATFQTGFIAPVGITVDIDRSEIYVADAGDDIVKTVPVAGGAPTKRARYDFDTFAANGLAYDGIGALAFITSGPLAIRVAALPRINPANTNYNRSFVGPTSGYGDLEFDRAGQFVLVANDEDDPALPTDTVNNYLFSVPRDAAEVDTPESSIGTPPEQLFGVAIDPVDQVIYFSSFSLDAAVESGNIYKREPDGEDGEAGELSVLLGNLTPVRVLGLELAPPTFGSFGGQLIATTEDTAGNTIFAIDPAAPSSFVTIPLSQPVSHLADLVFASTGELYAVENNGSVDIASASRILRITSSGTVTVIAASSSQLGAADGIEIDEGGDRLLVTSQTAGGFQLLEVSLGAIPATVKSLANIQIDDGFRPTGVIYDRLGTAVFRQSNANTQLGAVSVAP